MQSRLLLVLLPILACGGAGDVEPKSGTWIYGGSTIVSNECGDNVPIDPEGTFTLSVTADGKFTVDDNNFANGTFECTYDGGSFSCPVRAAETISESGIDAVGTYNVRVDGDIESATALSGVQTVDLDCAGADCVTAMAYFGIPQLPCSYSYSFEATAQ